MKTKDIRVIGESNCATTHGHRPRFELRVRTPKIEFRDPDDDDVVVLADLAAAGFHDRSTDVEAARRARILVQRMHAATRKITYREVGATTTESKPCDERVDPVDAFRSPSRVAR